MTERERIEIARREKELRLRRASAVTEDDRTELAHREASLRAHIEKIAERDQLLSTTTPQQRLRAARARREAGAELEAWVRVRVKPDPDPRVVSIDLPLSSIGSGRITRVRPGSIVHVERARAWAQRLESDPELAELLASGELVVESIDLEERVRLECEARRSWPETEP